MTIHTLSALELASAVRAGEFSAHEVLEYTMERARKVGLGAFTHLTEEYAAAQAERVDRLMSSRGTSASRAYIHTHNADESRGASGQGESGRFRASRGGPLRPTPLPPFAGVPVPVKDLTMVEGLPFEAGSRAMRGYVAPATDGVAQLLADAGTLMIGKTSTPEFGLPCYTEPAVGDPARTPWDPRRTAGGSSGGAAVAVAAGIVPVAHGSDGGGSLRIPAACCGVVGMKPSRGRVSSGPLGADGVALASDGVISRTVRDIAAFLDVLSRRWPGDAPLPVEPQSIDDGVPSLLASCGRPREGLRIGVLLEPLNTDEIDLHREAERAVERAAEHLRAMGHRVTPAPRPMTGAEWQAFMPLWSVGAASVPLPPEAEELLMPLTRYLREIGQRTSAVDYAGAYTEMQRLVRKIAAAWQDFDMILTPTLSGPPAFPGDLQLPDPAEDFEAQKRFTPWTSIWNMTGAPSISLPLHRGLVDGVELPFGVMLSGVRIGQDATVLALAAALEEADPWPLITEPRNPG